VDIFDAGQAAAMRLGSDRTDADEPSVRRLWAA
jgi:hypothetical protein